MMTEGSPRNLPTIPDMAANAAVRRARRVVDFAMDHGLPPRCTRLLQAIVDGRRDERIAELFGPDVDVGAIEQEFEAKSGRTVYVVATEIRVMDAPTEK